MKEYIIGVLLGALIGIVFKYIRYVSLMRNTHSSRKEANVYPSPARRPITLEGMKQ